MKKIKGLLSSILVVSLLTLGIYWAFEPEISKISIGQKAWAAETASAEIDVTLSVTEGITISGPGNIAMGSGSIGVSQDDLFGTGSAWTVTTNSASGYTLTLNTDTPSAMDFSSTSGFSDYTETSAGTPDQWSVDAANYEFGFSVCGTDVSNSGRSWGTSSNSAGCTCGSGSTPTTSAALLWIGFTGTATITVATSGSPTSQSGTETTLCVGAEQGSNVFAPDGSYTADVTGTAISP